MTDRDDLDRLLRDTPPPGPDAASRARDISAAMAAFDTVQQKNQTVAQGSPDPARPMVRHSRLVQFWRRMMTMNFAMPQTRVMMMGTASVAVMVLAIGMYQAQIGDGWNPKVLPADDAASTGAVLSLAGPSQSARLEDREGEIDTLRRALEEAPVTESLPALTLPVPEPAPMASADQNNQGHLLAAPSTGGSSEVIMLPKKRRRGVMIGRRQDTARLGAAGCAAGTAACQPGGGAVPLAVPLKRERYANGAVSAEADVIAPPLPPQVENRDRFEDVDPNRIKVTAEEPVSTFSIDVDTASYAFVRGALMGGVLPPKDAVRVEEMVNYFPYDYAPPTDRATPFATHVSVMPTPWNADTQLMRIGIKGYDLTETEKPRSNLVFLLDTSGSMNQPNKLPLLKNAFRMLVQSLDADDTVSIVTYAGSAGTVLEPTRASEAGKILAALDRLQAGGSTAGGEGIRQAYRLAEANFDKDGVNRVLLATDGDFNVGISDPEQLQDFVERKRETGVFLSVLGFGRGNYNDQLMQVLAQNGNGTAAYIDTLNEARKVMVEEAGSTLFPIAKDVKIQVEFNPATVAEYRLIGFETRMLNREDFNNDRVDAGEIGSGHTVTALYEITPVGSDARQVDPLRYQAGAALNDTAGELAFLKIRYKQPDSDTSSLITRPVTRADAGAPDGEARFAAAVAAFGQILKGGRHTGQFGYDDVIALANGAKGDDPFGYRAEFVNLVRLAQSAAALPAQRQ